MINTRLFLCSVCLFIPSLVSAQEDAAPFEISGVWMPTALGPDGNRYDKYPADMPFLPEIEAGLEDFEANFNPVVDDQTRSCLPYGMPYQMLGTAQYPIEVLESENQITIITELHNDVRRIYMDGREKPQGLLPTWMGFSVGFWEGDELVIETGGLREKGYPRPQSQQAVVHERIRLVDSDNAGPMLQLEVTINDPKVYSSPITVWNYFRRYPGLEMGEYFCSEDLWRQSLDEGAGDIPWR